MKIIFAHAEVLTKITLKMYRDEVNAVIFMKHDTKIAPDTGTKILIQGINQNIYNDYNSPTRQ